MSRIASRIGLSLISLLITANLLAQNNRSAVSVTGSDSNSCQTTSPCRSFSTALAHTNAGGEVIAFDSGGYGPFTISTSMTVLGAPGVHAALTVGNGNGIEVAAATADKVKIRNLTIIVNGIGNYGINASSFGALAIQNCNVTGGQYGIWIHEGGVPSGSYAALADTVVNFATGWGFLISSPAALTRCRAEKNYDAGLRVNDGPVVDGVVSAVDFVSVGNGSGAVVYSTTAGHNPILSLDRAFIASNTYVGVNSSAGATVRVNHSTVTDNGQYGFQQAGTSVLASMGNNMVAGNGFDKISDTNGTITVLTAH
jgi:hypothetical protein